MAPYILLTSCTRGSSLREWTSQPSAVPVLLGQFWLALCASQGKEDCVDSQRISALLQLPQSHSFHRPSWNLKRVYRDTHLLVSITMESGEEILLDIDASCLIVLNCAQPCPTLCDSMDYSPPGSSVHGMSQARILEWVAASFSRGSSPPRGWTCASCLSCIGSEVLYHWANWEVLCTYIKGN